MHLSHKIPSLPKEEDTVPYQYVHGTETLMFCIGLNTGRVPSIPDDFGCFDQYQVYQPVKKKAFFFLVL